MKISMLIPTRDRPRMREAFLQSVASTTKELKDITLYFICDNDDITTINHIKNLALHNTALNIQLLTRPRSEMLNEDYYNWAARQADGDLLWVLADDIIIVHPNWDERVKEVASSAFEKWPDRVICFSIKDNTPPPSHRIPKFPCFPMLTPQALRALGGWILHPKVPTWGADYITYCIFEPIGRLIEMHETNYLNHVSWHTKQVEIDPINQRIGAIFNKYKMIPNYSTDRIIAEECQPIRLQLKEYIKQEGGQCQ